tara:strand:+ start:265 stop:408 length:144 start_codon:yes stop_codon:yes gene_type:complete
VKHNAFWRQEKALKVSSLADFSPMIEAKKPSRSSDGSGTTDRVSLNE